MTLEVEGGHLVVQAPHYIAGFEAGLNDQLWVWINAALPRDLITLLRAVTQGDRPMKI